MEKLYAHSTKSQDRTNWQSLSAHLTNVAKLAGEFAAAFRAEQWGHCAGRLHDAGKATKKFQQRLEGSGGRVDHSTFGARWAWQHCDRLGVLLAYVIAGHHGGLSDGGAQSGQLHFRLKQAKLQPILQEPSEKCMKLTLPFVLVRGQAGFSISLFVRMVFSCLVDADFIDTENFFSPERSRLRFGPAVSNQIPALLKVFQVYMQEIIKQARPGQVNVLRREVFEECISKADQPRQIFSLTVPTGGGKTYSSMAFALHHAAQNGLRRVIYAIPFTSIIEQNAAVFKGIFGRDMVLEHHSNFMENDDSEDDECSLKNRLAMENWDMPIVVTTNVQFFESLFAYKTSRCRKLHNVANSVIVLDEAQAIPIGYLQPCMAVLQELVNNYGCSVVLCTATQPALDDTSSLRKHALSDIQEIVSSPNRLFAELKRTNITFIGKKTDDELAEALEQERQALCIVSTKPQARTVFERVSDRMGTYHLSTNMYPLHRQRVLQEIRDCLAAGKPCRVVSTSLVEAGVDLDFPVVYRAMAGLDSIAQAAGRCNREGRLNDQGMLGQVFVFETETMPSMPWLKRCITRAREALRSLPDADPFGAEMIRRYFTLLYDIEELDSKGIMRLLNPALLDKDMIFPYKEAGDKFCFIEEDTSALIVPLEKETASLIQTLKYSEYTRSIMRKLQPYTIQVRKKDIEALDRGGSIEIIHNNIPVLLNNKAYDKDVGLCIERAAVWDVEQLVT